MLSHITSATKTALIFSAACSLVPAVILTCFTVQIWSKITHRILTMKYPHLEISQCASVRSVLDTTRNAGVVMALVKVHTNDCLNVDAIKAKLMELVVLKENKMNVLCFPKVSKTLVSCWGRYAWTKDSSFDINNHVILAPSTFRGRQISDATIQEYAGDVASKYMAPNIPPWQIHVIPATNVASMSSEASSGAVTDYYMLLRIHHQLLAEEPSLKLGDLLLICQNNVKSTVSSPLEKILQPPVHTFDLYSRLMVGLCNRWNEFIYEFDKHDGSDSEKVGAVKNLSQLLSVILISAVTVANDFLKGFHALHDGSTAKLQFIKSLLHREVVKRNLSWDVATDAVMNSMNPLKALPNITKKVIRGCLMSILIWPPLIYNELMAFRCCFFLGHGGYPSTMVGFLCEYVPLVSSAAGELLQIVKTVVQLPRKLLELILESDGEEHPLIMPSFGGRKIISWSRPVRVSKIRRFATKFNVSESEVMLAAIGPPLKDSLESVDSVSLPKQINVNYKCIRIDKLIGKDSGSFDLDGLVCLKLQLLNSAGRQLIHMQQQLKHATDNQFGIFILTLLNTKTNWLAQMFPAIWIKILINHLSKKFTISVTEVLETASSRWTNYLGDSVDEFIYFEPLQSKMCTSITIQRFGGNIQMGVSTDVQMTPSHTKLTNMWHNNVINWIQ